MALKLRQLSKKCQYTGPPIACGRSHGKFGKGTIAILGRANKQTQIAAPRRGRSRLLWLSILSASRGNETYSLPTERACRPILSVYGPDSISRALRSIA